MPLTAAFTVSNNIVTPSTFQIVDTSTGSDGTVTKFVVFIYDAANIQIPGSPFTFAYTPNATYNLAVLTQDIAVNIIVQWQTVASAVQVTTNQIFVFTGFLEWFNYGILQQVSAQNRLLVDRNFFSSMSELRNLIDNANKSIEVGNSIFNAEAMIILAQYMANNPTLFF